MSSEEFDELVVYVASLKKSFSRKLDDHLFIIQQQNQRLDDQTRLIDELAWQVRDLRASVRCVGDKLKAVQDQGAASPATTTQLGKADYANVSVRRVPSIRRVEEGQKPVTRPRIKIVSEEISEGVEIIEEEEEGEDLRGGESRQRLQMGREEGEFEDDNVEGLYEPIRFVQRRDYTAPPAPVAAPTGPNISLSARHRQIKQHKSLSTSTTPTNPTESSISTDSRGMSVGQSQFYRPLPTPPASPFEAPPDADRSLLRSKDYPFVQTRRINRLQKNGSTSSSVLMTNIEEELLPEEQNVDEFIRISSTSSTATASERDTNSIRRRAYILPSKPSSIQ